MPRILSWRSDATYRWPHSTTKWAPPLKEPASDFSDDNRENRLAGRGISGEAVVLGQHANSVANVLEKCAHHYSPWFTSYQPSAFSYQQATADSWVAGC
jgi:hypothetical protein